MNHDPPKTSDEPKFACKTSLAVPLRDPATSAILGAIAVSTGDVLHEQHPVWTTIVNLAAEVSRELSTR